MKKQSFFILILILGIILQSNSISAQSDSDVFSFMKSHLSSDESSQIVRAKADISKGEKLESNIKEEDAKIDKYKKKRKKYEKKSIDVKKYRIKQALYYDRAYSLVYNVYNEKISNATFIYDEDQAKANDLLDEASTNLSTAKRRLKAYRNASKKDLKKKFSYTKIKSDLQSAVSTEITAIQKLIEAYSVFLDQKQKKQLEEEENRVWMNTQSDNTVLSYKNYLDEYPNGKYASEARQKLTELEQTEKDKKAQEDLERTRSLQGALVFKVQIAASKRPIPKWTISRFYKKTQDVEMMHYDNWYKYAIGSFNTYQEAKKFLRTVRVRGAFVVAYKNNQKLHIKEAISLQKGSSN